MSDLRRMPGEELRALAASLDSEHESRSHEVDALAEESERITRVLKAADRQLSRVRSRRLDVRAELDRRHAIERRLISEATNPKGKA